MKRRIIIILAVLPSVIMLLLSCNEIETVCFDSIVTGRQQVSMNTKSAHVTSGEANEIADTFMISGFGGNGVSTKSSVEHTNNNSSIQTIRENGQDLMYVFNYENGGFVIVGATRNYYPVLAYSDKGAFVFQDDMGPVDVWLDETKVCIQNSSKLDDATKMQMQMLWSRYGNSFADHAQELLPTQPQTRSTGEDACWERIETLQALYGSEGWTFNSLSNAEYYFDEWGFEDLYDDICYNASQNHSDPAETVIGYKYPVYNHIGPLLSTEWHQNAPYNDLCPNHYPAGCTAIASGQVMKYFEYPTTMSWNDTIFTWTDIPVTPTTSSRHPQLIRMLGQLFNMQYGQDESTATASAVINGLTSLGYSVTQPQPHSYSTVRDTLLNSRKPILMMGFQGQLLTSGHMWVCDGVTESIANQIIYYTENQPYGAGTFTQGLYTHNNPGVFGGTLFYYSLHINWCYDENNVDLNGWFLANDLTPGNGVYKYGRENIYIVAPSI